MSILLVDVDGVLADFVGHLRAELAKLGHEIGEVTTYDFLPGFGDACGADARTLLNDGETWRAIPAYDAAKRALAEIEKAGHEIVAVTSPWHSCKEWASVRREWIDRHFGLGGHQLIVTSRKELVRGNAFIDDRVETVEAWEKRNPNGLPLVMDRPWTRSATERQLFAWERDVPALLEWLSRGDA